MEMQRADTDSTLTSTIQSPGTGFDIKPRRHLHRFPPLPALVHLISSHLMPTSPIPTPRMHIPTLLILARNDEEPINPVDTTCNPGETMTCCANLSSTSGPCTDGRTISNVTECAASDNPGGWVCCVDNASLALSPLLIRCLLLFRTKPYHRAHLLP
jgi:hypothetical protein